MRHREGVAHRDHRQALLYCLAQAAGAGFADEEVGQRHVAPHILSELDHHMVRGLGLRSQFRRQRGVVAAHQDQRDIAQLASDGTHDARTDAAEQHQTGRTIRMQAELHPFRTAVNLQGPIEVGADDHARGHVQLPLGIARGAGLCQCCGRAADNMLLLCVLDPKVRWKVRHVGHDGHVRYTGQCSRKTLIHHAVEIGNQRDDHIGFGAQPMLSEAPMHRCIAEPDESLQQHQFLAHANGPAAGQALVVQIFR